MWQVSGTESALHSLWPSIARKLAPQSLVKESSYVAGFYLGFQFGGEVLASGCGGVGGCGHVGHSRLGGSSDIPPSSKSGSETVLKHK